MLQNFKNMQNQSLRENKKSTPGVGNSNLLLKLEERVFKTHSMFWMSMINLKSTFYN